MRDDRPSGTSLLVSFARALGVDDRFLDPIAPELLPRWMARLATLPATLGPAGELYRRAIRGATFGLVDHNVLRTLAIDAHLLDAIEAGVRQLVILGAGMDARAWRLEALRGVTVFEVDHPATQRYKRQRVTTRKPPTDIRYVAVDFEKQSFDEQLLRAGLLRAEPSVWIWEGVAMYLPLPAIEDTLRQVTSLASNGSVLSMTYMVPNHLPFGAMGRAAIPALFAVAGEPLQGAFEPSALAAILNPEWTVTYDQDPRGWRDFTGSAATPTKAFMSERLAVATRTGGG